MTRQPRILVVGGGIAGMSAAAFLARRTAVTVVEMESSLTYHSTGRSAAIFHKSYGSTAQLTAASEMFFAGAAEGYADAPLLSPRGVVVIAREDQLRSLRAWRAAGLEAGASEEWLEPTEVQEAFPAVRPGYAAAGVLEADAQDLDVAGTHQAYVRMVRANGGEILTKHPLTALRASEAGWQATAGDRQLEADVVVDAAGAWGDRVAALAGIAPVGLTPRRRTAFMVPGPVGASRWPMLIDADEQWYVKPDGPQMLCSPADETPSEPCDARPDEADVALAIERINRATTLEIRTVRSQWAGLRTFAPDRVPVIGYETGRDDFFWLVGQGGTGIQSSPAAGRLAASLLLEREVPPDLALRGVTAEMFSPDRFR